MTTSPSGTDAAATPSPSPSPAIHVDQFLSRPPAIVWRALTDPDLLARWWAPGDIRPVAGHEFVLDMQGWGNVACTVLEVEPERRLAVRFGERWTITWRLEAEGDGTRLFLEHAGFDLDDPQDRFALDRMGPGWRDDVLPRLARLIDELGG